LLVCRAFLRLRELTSSLFMFTQKASRGEARTSALALTPQHGADREAGVSQSATGSGSRGTLDACGGEATGLPVQGGRFSCIEKHEV
jgi:hypothetical protein